MDNGQKSTVSITKTSKEIQSEDWIHTDSRNQWDKSQEVHENDNVKTEKPDRYSRLRKIENIESIQLNCRKAEQCKWKKIFERWWKFQSIKKWGTEVNTQKDTQGWILWKI